MHLLLVTLLAVASEHLSCASRWVMEEPSSEKEESTSDYNPAHYSDLNKAGSCYCGVANEAVSSRGYSNRVVGGEDSLVGEWPWQVAILTGSDLSSQVCGGSLVSGRHVLTAAHCTAAISSGELSVGLGFTNITSGDWRQHKTLIIKVVEVIDHPNYKGFATKYEDDISVLVLAEEVELTQWPHIKPACLPGADGEEDQYAGSQAVVSGWGLTDFYNGSYPKHLRDVTVTVYGRRECGLLTPVLRDSQLCAGHDDGGRDACSGDSGGPLVTRQGPHWTLIGVVSAGDRCARRGYPGLYTDVHHYMASGWLTEMLRDAETCPPPPEAKEDIVSVKEKTTTPTAATSTTPELSENDATSYSDVLLVIGGSGYSFGRKVELWSTNQVCSRALADLPNLRTNLDAATLDGQPIVCGGDHTPYSCMKMNPDFTWSQFIFTKARRSHHSMVSYGPGALIFGGHLSNSVEYLYNGTSVTLRGRVPRLDSSCAVLSDRDTVIITGGITAPAHAWEFSLSSGDWSRLPDVPAGGRYRHSCAFVTRDGLRGAMIAGGSDGRRLRAETFYYSVETETWSRLRDLPGARWGARMANMDGDTLIIGGGNGRDFVSEVHRFNFHTLSWDLVGPRLMYPRADFGLVVLQSGCKNVEEGGQKAQARP